MLNWTPFSSDISKRGGFFPLGWLIVFKLPSFKQNVFRECCHIFSVFVQVARLVGHLGSDLMESLNYCLCIQFFHL